MTSKTHRLSRCHRHPTKPVTGFCASCLRERLAGIESSSDDHPAGESPPSPELRRIKSLSAGRADLPSSSSEPRRRSCEIRADARSTLCELFNIDDEKKKRTHQNRNPKLAADSGNYGFGIKEDEHDNGGNGAVRVFGEGFVCEEDDEETKTMKEFIDLELRCKKNASRDFRDIAGSFCRRLRNWSGKRKLKKNRGGGGGGDGGAGLMSMGVGKQGVRSRGFRETQSEVGEYGLLGRRSCDTDPRLSVDAGRMSLDDSRFSFEAARASWDGYLIGRACSRLCPMVPVNGVVGDGVLVEEEEEEKVNLESGEEEQCPGGSSQTKVYYSNSQRRRRSFDRSNSRRKPSMADVDELRVVSNAKVSPATSELFYGAKVLITEKDLRNANLKSSDNVQPDCVMGSASKDAGDDVASGVSQRGLKKVHKWGRLWNKLGMVQRREDKVVEEEECAAADTLNNNKPVAESWQKLRRVVNGQASESVSQKLIRSYSVSCRNPSRMGGFVNGFGGGPETNGSVLNGRQEFMLQRNRSVRYSPNNGDTGLLRFYLTPLKSYRRSRSGRSSLKDLNPTARSVL